MADITAKEWLTALGLIDRLRWSSDMHGMMLTILLLRLEKTGVLSASQREQIEADWDEVYRMAKGGDLLAHEPRDPRTERRAFLTESGKVVLRPESFADPLETEFDAVLQQASFKYRSERDAE
ncbi:MAG: hypothetical protein HY038_11480 [Nitrospirae bacterium]|nr:hypothetical protein [Nitrospirota bacterium]